MQQLHIVGTPLILKGYIEAVQRRTARFSMSNYNRTSSYSVTLVLRDLNWNTLCDIIIYRRKGARLYMFAVQKLAYWLTFLCQAITPATRFTIGHNLKFILPQLIHKSLVFSLTRLLYGILYPLKQYMHTQSIL